jgi:hypothetical protein
MNSNELTAMIATIHAEWTDDRIENGDESSWTPSEAVDYVLNRLRRDILSQNS